MKLSESVSQSQLPMLMPMPMPMQMPMPMKVLTALQCENYTSHLFMTLDINWRFASIAVSVRVSVSRFLCLALVALLAPSHFLFHCTSHPVIHSLSFSIFVGPCPVLALFLVMPCHVSCFMLFVSCVAAQLPFDGANSMSSIWLENPYASSGRAWRQSQTYLHRTSSRTQTKAKVENAPTPRRSKLNSVQIKL